MRYRFDPRRRNFLIGTLALPFVSRVEGQTALNATLQKTEAGLDQFISEKYHDQVAQVLAQWSAGLLHSPKGLFAIENSLASSFQGFSPLPAKSRMVRPGAALEVRQLTFSPQTALAREAFMQQFQASLSVFEKIYTADFQVTAIESKASGSLRTTVRYEFVGSGQGFHREQRVGEWNLEWDEYRVRLWQDRKSVV